MPKTVIESVSTTHLHNATCLVFTIKPRSKSDQSGGIPKSLENAMRKRNYTQLVLLTFSEFSDLRQISLNWINNEDPHETRTISRLDLHEPIFTEFLLTLQHQQRKLLPY